MLLAMKAGSIGSDPNSRRGDAYGATTGATIRVVGASGIACSFGFYIHAAAAAVMALLALSVLGAFEPYLHSGSKGG